MRPYPVDHDVGGIHAARLDGQKTLARSPDGAGILPQHPGVAVSDREVPLVETCRRAAMMICSRKQTKLRHRLGTKVRVRFTIPTADKTKPRQVRGFSVCNKLQLDNRITLGCNGVAPDRSWDTGPSYAY